MGLLVQSNRFHIPCLFSKTRCVQVKLSGVSKADRAEMEQEIDLLKKLQHLNVVKHVETIVNDSLNIVLEYVDGGTLTDQLANFSKKPEALVAYYSLQILSGLAYIHSQGLFPAASYSHTTQHQHTHTHTHTMATLASCRCNSS